MTGGWGKRHAVFLTGAAAIALSYGIAGAQVAPVGGSTTGQQGTGTQPATGTPSQGQTPSLSVTGNFRSQIRVDDNGGLRANSPGTDTSFTNSLSVDIESRTPIQSLSLTFGGLLQYEDLAVDREENGLEDPFARLNYTLDGADSQLSFNGNYRTDEIVDSILVDTDGDLIDDTLLTTTGSIENINLSTSYSFGLQAPFGMDFVVRRDERNYSDVFNPNLFDRTTDRYDVTARFAINPATTARIIARKIRYDAEDAERTDRDTTDLGVGINYQISPDLTLDAQVTQTEIDETQTISGSRRTTQRDGFSGNIRLTRDLANGTIGVFVDRVQSTNTARTDIGVDRAMTLPSGALSFGVAGVA